VQNETHALTQEIIERFDTVACKSDVQKLTTEIENLKAELEIERRQVMMKDINTTFRDMQEKASNLEQIVTKIQREYRN